MNVNISLQQLGIKGTEDWFFGNMTRDRANEILLKEAVGVYLIRASSQPGSFALSVRDRDKTNHYKIEARKRQMHDGYKFVIGSLDFPSMLQLIEHYKKTQLVDSTLTVPASKPVYRAKYDFKAESKGPDSAHDLDLKRNECVYYLGPMLDSDGLEIADWWRVQKRSTGDIGHVPANYLAPVTIGESEDVKFQALRQLNFPFDVEVMRERIPNVFDATQPPQLRLEVGDIVEVLRACEQQPEFWIGMCRRTQKQGLFPFNYVRPALGSGLSSARLGSQSFSSRDTRASRFTAQGPAGQGDQPVLVDRL